MARHRVWSIVAAGLLSTAVACGGSKPPVAAPQAPSPQPFPTAGGSGGGSGRGTTTVPAQPTVTPPSAVSSTPIDPIAADPLGAMTPEQINQQSPLQPVFFAYDSDQVDDAGRRVLGTNAELLKKYSSWVVSIEGHSDERGTAEYNLALGERRALSAKTYLLSLGITADRLRTVSYGKEFPFDPGHDEAAFSKNRRAHFMVTSK
jgi:peptidoglycan-associated lipoprotein